MATVTVEVEGRTLSLSNLDKTLFPDGFTKAQVIRYATAIAPAWLPHLRDRALTVRRFPDGTDGPSFFEKRCPSHAPEWVTRVPVWITTGGGRWGQGGSGGAGGQQSVREEVPFIVADSVPTLVWLANMAAIELHTPMGRAASRGGHLEPTMIVFDLDPGPPAGAVECAVVALRVRDILDTLGLVAVVKSSGSKGIQVYLPLNRPAMTYDRTRAFAQAVAQLLEKQDPGLVVSVQNRDRRAGKVLVDWYQNEPGKTTVAAYSLRARERPYVSTPLSWEEVEAIAAGEGQALFVADEVVDRVHRVGDLFAPAAELEQDIPDLG